MASKIFWKGLIIQTDNGGDRYRKDLAQLDNTPAATGPTHCGESPDHNLYLEE